VRLQQTLTTSLCVVLFACEEPSIPFGDQSGTSGRVNIAELQGTLHAELGTNWADFDRALGTITPWTGGHHQRRCTDMFACGLLLSKARVDIQANPESKIADYNNVGTYGTILMRLENRGDRPTGEYSLLPHPTEYYVVVRNAGPKAWQWAFVEKSKTTPPRVAGAWNKFNDCTPQHLPKNSTANFQTCHAPEPELVGIRTSSFLGLTDLGYSLAKAILAFAFEPPGWISCAYGCCTLGY